MRRGVCVQIGIESCPEYLYLTAPDWRTHRLPEIITLPHVHFEDIGVFDYYGVDCDPNSIAFMANRLGDKGNWLTACVTGETSRFRGFSSYFFHDRCDKGLISTTITLQQLVSGLMLSYIDVLAVDVEGSEADVFESYDWCVYPRFVTVEIHSYESFDAHRDRVLFCLSAHGYDLISETPTNVGNQYPTVEAKFIRRPLV